MDTHRQVIRVAHAAHTVESAVLAVVIRHYGLELRPESEAVERAGSGQPPERAAA